MSGGAKGKRSTRSQDRLGRYYTPDAHARLVANEALHGVSANTVLDPSAGSGQLLAACLTCDPQLELYGIDVDPTAPMHDYPRIRAHQEDFLAMEPGGWVWYNQEIEIDVIVMNPPYSIVQDRDGKDVSCEVATAHVRHAIKWAKMRVAALMSVAFLGGITRYLDFWKNDRNLRKIIFIPNRPSYTGKGTASSDYVLLIFEPGDRVGPIHFEWKEA